MEPWYDLGSNWLGGVAPSNTGSARFNANAAYQVWWDSVTVSRQPSVGQLLVTAGNVTFLNRDSSPLHTLQINGSGGSGAFSDFSVAGANTELALRGVRLNSLGGGQIVDGATLRVDGSHSAGAALRIGGGAGLRVDGQLRAQNGGSITGSRAYIGYEAGSSGNVQVVGNGSTFQWSNGLTIGHQGSGVLALSGGGTGEALFASIAGQANSVGELTVSGAGSSFLANGSLAIGHRGHGSKSILQGANLSTQSSMIGLEASGVGIVRVNGVDSIWNAYGGSSVGYRGNGQLHIENGGLVDGHWSSFSTASETGSTGLVRISGLPQANSFLLNVDTLMVGENGAAELDIRSRGLVSSWDGVIAANSGSTGAVSIVGDRAEWSVQNELKVGLGGTGSINVGDGGGLWTGSTLVGNQASSKGTVVIAGEGSTWFNGGELTTGLSGEAEIVIQNGGLLQTGFNAPEALMHIGSVSRATTTVTGSGSRLVSDGRVLVNVGEFRVLDGAAASTQSAYLGIGNGLYPTEGVAVVSGAGSRWTIDGDVEVGSDAAVLFESTQSLPGHGRLLINNGGMVVSHSASIGRYGSRGLATVEGDQSHWDIHGSLEISGPNAAAGNALTIGLGAKVHVQDHLSLGPNGTLNLYGGTLQLNTFSRHANSNLNYVFGTIALDGDRNIGPFNESTEFFGSSPSITAGKHLLIHGNANLLAPTTLNGGTLSVGSLTNAPLLTFNTGTLNLAASDLRVGSSGQFGNQLTVNNGQSINVSQLTSIDSGGSLIVQSGGRLSSSSLINHGSITLAGLNARLVTNSNTLHNHGLLVGDGSVVGGFVNHSTGVISVDAGKRLQFSHALQNLAGGRITGRGTIAAPKIENQGQLLFSGGFTDLFSDLQSATGSQFIITGGSTTTVFGDVEIMGGAELRISDASNAVFFDHVQLRNGSLLTGGGQAYFEGSLGIGNSPSRQVFNFNVTLGATSNLLVEIAGTDPILPEFDQYVFLRDLTLQGGALTFDLIGLNPGDPMYSPQLGDSFRIIEVSGLWTGQFGTYNFPTLAPELRWNRSNLYTGGIVSVAAVPEPSGMLLVGLAVASGAVLCRRRSMRGPCTCLFS